VGSSDAPVLSCRWHHRRYPRGETVQIGSIADAVLLVCCRYDPSAGKYDWLAGRLLGIAGLLTVLILVTFLVILA
jgi:hypothetical protein